MKYLDSFLFQQLEFILLYLEFVYWLCLFFFNLNALALILGIFKIQQAFQHGQASSLIPIQQVPIQLGPIFVYFSIFMLTPPQIYSFPFMLIAVGCIILSSFLLAQRQAQLEEIK